MTLEGIFLFLHLRIAVQVLHSDSSLYGAEDVALLVGEHPDASGLILEGGLPTLVNVAHVSDVPYKYLAA